jgi:hypothetical protein
VNIANEVAHTPCLQENLDGAVQEWREADGTAFAFCATVYGVHWIDMPGIARFGFERAPGEVDVVPYPGVGPEVVGDAYRGTALPMILQARGVEVLHASANLTERGVVAFCGASGTGKSTIAVGLNHRGYEIWADDAVALGESGVVIPLPFRAHLRPTAAAFFGAMRKEASGGEARKDGPAGRVASSREPLAAVCVLERVTDLADRVVVERLGPPAALRSVLAHAFCFSLQDPQCKRRMTEHYLQLVGRVACFAVRFQPGLEGLSTILDAVEREVIGT